MAHRTYFTHCSLRLSLEVLKVDEERGREKDHALVFRQRSILELELEFVLVGEKLGERTRPFFGDSRDRARAFPKWKGPRLPDRR